MPKLTLSLHPDSQSPAARIDVEAARGRGLLWLSYHVSGGLDRVKIPSAQPPSRTDGLWKHTCFEVFLRAGSGYYEFNLSPSGQWAAYRFDGHRVGMREFATPDPLILWHGEEGQGTLSAAVPLPEDVRGPLGLSAIVEDLEGNRSFWALAHPPGAPDFHNAACFAAELPSAG